MKEVKTKRNDASVADFLNAIEDDQTRADCRVIDAIMQKAARARPGWSLQSAATARRRAKHTSG